MAGLKIMRSQPSNLIETKIFGDYFLSVVVPVELSGTCRWWEGKISPGISLDVRKPAWTSYLSFFGVRT